jgi:hypothetical protein
MKKPRSSPNTLGSRISISGMEVFKTCITPPEKNSFTLRAADSNLYLVQVSILPIVQRVDARVPSLI